MLTRNSPKGPKNLQSGARGGRGGRGAAQGRGAFDSALHRTRGSDRINSHTRGAPKGPKQMNGKPSPALQKALNGFQGQQMPNPMMMPGGQQGQISPQQQMDFYQMMEQQAKLLSASGFINGMPGQPFPGQQPGFGGGSNSLQMYQLRLICDAQGFNVTVAMTKRPYSRTSTA